MSRRFIFVYILFGLHKYLIKLFLLRLYQKNLILWYIKEDKMPQNKNINQNRQFVNFALNFIQGRTDFI